MEKQIEQHEKEQVEARLFAKESDWDFGTFEAMLAGMESEDELEGMLDCLNASKVLSESEIEDLRKTIEKKMEDAE